MSKYKAILNPGQGILEYENGKSAPLIEESLDVSGCYYRLHDDLVVPGNSKVHTNVELMVDAEAAKIASTTVVTEPLINAGQEVCAARSCSTVKEGMFMTEFINGSANSVKLEAGTIIGYAEFVREDDFNDMSTETDMFCSYSSDDSAYETDGESESEEADNEMEDSEEISCDPPPHPNDPNTRPKEIKRQDEDIPEGAKKLSINYSKMSKEAKPYTKQLKDLLENKHEAAFSKHDRDYGKTTLVQYRAHLKDPDAPPVASPPYRTRPEMREVVDEQAFQMIADGLVSHSTSPYSAPILLAKKKCGGWRFLTDFRKINERCNKVVYPLPRIEDSLQRLENPRLFSSLDLTKGFWQIPIHPDDRKYFAFSTETMHLEYLVAPMGAKNSPSYLTALMQLVLRGLPMQHVISYLDDILVADNNMESHLLHLDQVLTAIEKAGLKLNPAKCSLAQDSVICLGHKLSKDGVAPDPANIEKIRSWKPPKNKKAVKSFLGLTGYYRPYVKDYSHIANDLTDLTRDDASWMWIEKHQRAFDTLKRILVSDQIMHYPDFKRPFIVKSDASLTSIGYVLTQKFDGREKVISYGSKKLSRPQQRWSTYDREYFALIAAIRANAHYLRHAPFTAITDHRPLLAWRKTDQRKDPTGRRTRWAIELDNYEFELIYKKGKIHSDADAMSRRGDDDDEDIAQDDEEFAASLDPQENDGITFLAMSERDEASAVTPNAMKEDIARLRREQNADSIISEVKDFVKRRRRLPKEFPERWYMRNFRSLALREGILYRKAYSQMIDQPILQAIIPDSMIEEILSDLHGARQVGHPGAEKMLLKVRRYANWPSIAQDVETHIKNCKICDQMREEVPGSRTPLVPIEPEQVFDHVVCDLVALPKASLGYCHVLVFKDIFSGYVKLYKLKGKLSIGVAKAFEHLTCTLGPPRLLTSDNGGEFISHLMEAVCKLKGSSKRTSVAYRPQSQGTVERQNRTLIKDLTKCLAEYGSSWVDHLQYVEWTYNTLPISKTNMSPFYVFFGREPYAPPYADIDGSVIKDKDLRSYFEKMKARVKAIHDKVFERTQYSNAKSKEQYDKKVKHKPLKSGELAYERVPDGLRHKLQPKWVGPVEIVRRRSSSRGDPGTTYEVRRRDGSRTLKNYEQLKRVNAKFDEIMQQPLPKKVKAASIIKAEDMAVMALQAPRAVRPDLEDNPTAGETDQNVLPNAAGEVIPDADDIILQEDVQDAVDDTLHDADDILQEDVHDAADDILHEADDDTLQDDVDNFLRDAAEANVYQEEDAHGYAQPDDTLDVPEVSPTASLVAEPVVAASASVGDISSRGSEILENSLYYEAEESENDPRVSSPGDSDSNGPPSHYIFGTNLERHSSDEEQPCTSTQALARSAHPVISTKLSSRTAAGRGKPISPQHSTPTRTLVYPSTADLPPRAPPRNPFANVQPDSQPGPTPALPGQTTLTTKMKRKRTPVKRYAPDFVSSYAKARRVNRMKTCFIKVKDVSVTKNRGKKDTNGAPVSNFTASDLTTVGIDIQTGNESDTDSRHPDNLAGRSSSYETLSGNE